MKHASLLPLFAALVAQVTIAQVEFRLAYRTEPAGCVPASFQNDQFFRCMSSQSIIAAPELREAVAVQSDGATYLSIKITPAARERLNALSAANSKAISEKHFEKTVGLGAVVNGIPRTVVQGIFQQFKKDEIRWYISTNARPSDLQEALDWAALINSVSQVKP